ncbi:MAG: DUF6502 family protein [Pseudomonadota bacterium]
MNAILDLVFRPLVRLAIARGLRFSEASERLRRAYVDVAREMAGEGATDSKISVMTGLQRRDIARLRADPAPDAPTRPDPLSRLVAEWLALHQGAPLPRHGPAPSFDALAWQIRRDVHPKSLLDALRASGTVAEEAETVRLLKRANVPLEGAEEQLDYLGRNVGDHLSVAVGNVLGEPPQFDLAVHYDTLSVAAAEELQALWRARMAPVLEELNAKARALQDAEAGPARIRGGGYFRLEVEE